MDNNNLPDQQRSHIQDKKEFRKQIAEKIEAALLELKDTLGEKKFHHRIKKAVKHITEGLHKKETHKAAKKIKVAVKKAAPQKRVIKKTLVKKADS